MQLLRWSAVVSLVCSAGQMALGCDDSCFGGIGKSGLITDDNAFLGLGLTKVSRSSDGQACASYSPALETLDVVVITDHETYAVLNQCKEGKRSLAVVVKEDGFFDMDIQNNITWFLWKGEFDQAFKDAVNKMKPNGPGCENSFSCLNLKPMPGVDSHKFDGPWVPTRHNGQIPECLTLLGKHEADLSSVTIKTFLGLKDVTDFTTGFKETTQTTLTPGKCVGGNVFNAADNTTKVVDTYLAGDSEYDEWALFHECADINGQTHNFALLLTKAGRYSNHIAVEVKKALDNSDWPADFKALVQAMEDCPKCGCAA